MFDITYIVLGVILILFGLAGKWLVPFIVAKTTSIQRENIRKVVKVLVEGAEQMFPSDKGEDKLQQVLELAQRYFEEKNIKIDADQLRAEIESQVLQLHNKIEDSDCD